MPMYEIRDHITSPALMTVEAATPLAALDAYAVAEGFSPYSDLPTEGTDGEWTYTRPDGLLGAVFTNYEIVAVPLD